MQCMCKFETDIGQNKTKRLAPIICQSTSASVLFLMTIFTNEHNFYELWSLNAIGRDVKKLKL